MADTILCPHCNEEILLSDAMTHARGRAALCLDVKDADVGRMISRSAYAQLNYSAVLLAGTIAGLTLIYLAPVLLALFSDGLTRIAGLAYWIAMAFLFQPTLRFYHVPPVFGLLLPAIAAIYIWFTGVSALAYARGRGGMWKGRAQANVSESNVSELR